MYLTSGHATTTTAKTFTIRTMSKTVVFFYIHTIYTYINILRRPSILSHTYMYCFSYLNNIGYSPYTQRRFHYYYEETRNTMCVSVTGHGSVFCSYFWGKAKNGKKNFNITFYNNINVILYIIYVIPSKRSAYNNCYRHVSFYFFFVVERRRL